MSWNVGQVVNLEVEADEDDLAPSLAERPQDVRRRLELDGPGPGVLAALAGDDLGGAVVRDCRGHHDDVGVVGARQDLALDVSDLLPADGAVRLDIECAPAGSLGATPLVIDDLRLETGAAAALAL